MKGGRVARSGTGLVGAGLHAACYGQSCGGRVGKGSPQANQTGEAQLPSACANVAAEAKMPFGSGATSFAFTWDIDHYVLVYSGPSTGSGDIYAAKVARDGSVAAPPVVIESTPATSDLPSLLKTGSGFLVVWQEGTAGKAVYAHALGPDAVAVGSGAAIASTQSAQSRPVLSR